MKFPNVLIEDDTEDEEGEVLTQVVAMIGGAGVWAPGVPAFHGPDTRSVLICGDITEEVANTVISQLLQLQEDDVESPIKIYVNTLGGDAASGFALYDWLRCLPMPVIGIAYGRCSSAGLPILMGADFRIATPHTRFFYHEVIYGTGMSSQLEAEDHRDNYRWYQDQMTQILRERAKINKTKWKKHFQGVTSWHFGAAEALELGIIHDVLDMQKKKIKIGEKTYG